jgi:hypothetical protein
MKSSPVGFKTAISTPVDFTSKYDCVVVAEFAAAINISSP